MPVGSEQVASTSYTGEAEEAYRPPRGVVCLERKSITIPLPLTIGKELFIKRKRNSSLQLYSLNSHFY
ncbi:hypothetical protein ACQCVP_04495 [Rossellomorea vietnamensis]